MCMVRTEILVATVQFDMSLLRLLILKIIVEGGEDGKQSGWSPADPSRKRHSGPIITSGTLSKQKNPVTNDSTISKEALVRC